MKQHINWKIFYILLGLSLLSVACIFPYVVSIQGEVLSKIGKPFELIFLFQLLQSLILFSFLIFFGLFFAKKIDFQLPVLEAVTEKGDWKVKLKNIFLRSVLIGAVVAFVIYALDPFFSIGGSGISTHQNYAPVWQKLLAAVYGGVAEEIIMRLFLLSFFVWVGTKFFKRDKPTSFNVIVSIILVAVIFGLGHLPITASVTKITSLVILRALILNGIAGVVFGWLFWKKGLESAIIAHFTADIFLITLLPLLFR